MGRRSAASGTAGTYYVISTSPNSIQLAPSYADAIAGNAIQIDSSGVTGTQHHFTVRTGAASRSLGTSQGNTLALADDATPQPADATTEAAPRVRPTAASHHRLAAAEQRARTKPARSCSSRSIRRV